MEQRTLLQQVIREGDADRLNGDLLIDPSLVDLSLIELLKKEVDHCLRSAPREAFKRAELLHRVSARSEDPLARALGLRTKGQALHVLCSYAETIDLYEQARGIYREHGRPVEAARVERAMVDALMYLSRYDEALAIARQARETFLAQGEHLLAAQLETNVGNLHHRLDQYEEALACYRRAAEAFTSANDLTALAVVTFNIANIHSNLDDFRESQALYERAYELHMEAGNALAATQVRYSLGYLHFLKGEYHPAMRVLHEVREESARLDDDRMSALCELDLAEIYQQLNVQEEAARLAENARDRFQKLGMRYEAAKALTYHGLACLHLDKLTEAEELLGGAGQEFAEEGNAVYQGLTCVYLAELSLKKQDADRAYDFAARAQAHFSGQGLNAKSFYARLLSAKALMQRGELEPAREICQAIMAVPRNLEAPWLIYQVHELLGDASTRMGELQTARDQYRKAIAGIEKIRAGIRVDEFRSEFLKGRLHVYKKMIRLCLEEGTAEGQAEAFYYLEGSKGRALADMLVNDLAPTPNAENEAQRELHQRWQRLRKELQWYSNKSSRNEVSGNTRFLQEEDTLWQEINARERALVEVAREAQIHDPHFVWLKETAGLREEEVRAALAENEVLIEYYFDGEELKIFVIDRDQLHVVESAYSREEVMTLIDDFQFQIEKFHYSHLAGREDTLLAGVTGCLREFYWALFHPVASFAEGKTLIFIPTELLHNIPFQALYDGANYLLDRTEISLAPSARMFLLTARQAPVESGAMRPLIFGAPDRMAPHIAEEISAIRALFPDAKYFAGPAATSRALAEHMPFSTLVHIACHAVFRKDNPIFSAFRLADTWQSFYDVSSLHAPGALVVLSGCSTGVEGIETGDEMVGLMRGFFCANAASLVVSLWPVNDLATAELMTSFYKQLKAGRRPRAALRQAAWELKQRYPHPYYWASFVLVGCDTGIEN